MTKNLQKEERKALEDYLLAGDDEQLAMKAINLNVQGSTPYYYLYFLHKFKTVGVEGLTDEDNVNLTKFTTQPNFENTWQAKQIALRHKLLKYDNASTGAEDRKQIITDLLENELRSFCLDHKKPDRGELDSESQQEDSIDKSNLVSVAPDLWKQKDQTKIDNIISLNERCRVLKEEYKA